MTPFTAATIVADDNNESFEVVHLLFEDKERIDFAVFLRRSYKFITTVIE